MRYVNPISTENNLVGADIIDLFNQLDHLLVNFGSRKMLHIP